MNEPTAATPDLTTALVDPPEFIDSAQSVDALLASVIPEDMKNTDATAMRLFAFRPEGTTERVALAFVGPEAVKVARVFTLYADELMARGARRAQEQ